MTETSVLRGRRLIPMIPPDRMAVEVLVERGIDTAIVSYHQLLLSGLLETAKKGELREHLGYDGSLLLSSVMPDEMLLDPKTFEDFVKVYEGGDFCAVIAWDVPGEIDLPEEEVLENIDFSLKRVEELKDMGINVIPLVKGNRFSEIKRSISGIKELGYSEVALHASEYVAAFGKGLEARALLRLYLTLLPRYFDRILLLGTLRPGVVKHIFRNYGQLTREKICFAGLSWWLDATKRRAYCKGKSVSLLDYAVRVVESGEILSHRSDVRNIAGHNLSYMSHLLHGKEINAEQYDAILELPALAISDIHIGTPESMAEEAIDLIRKYRPKTLILLGDIFDYNGEVRPYHVILLFSVIEGIDNIVVIRGDAEEGSKLCPHEKFLNVLDALVFSEEPWTAPLRQRFRIQRYILWFYKYNRVMRERAKVLLPSGKSVLLIHGHQLGSHTLARDKVLERARYKKAMFNADWILLGHFHRPLLSLEDGVIVLGAWQRQTENMERIGFQPARSAVLIDEDETIEVLES